MTTKREQGEGLPELPEPWADTVHGWAYTADQMREYARAALLGEADEGNEFFPIPAGLHPHTVNLVARFAAALADKLAKAERKYGWSDGWASPDWMDECRAKLLEHVAKGDPRDVAAYCAFLWHHRESTAPHPAAPAGVRDEVLRQIAREMRSRYAAAGNPLSGPSHDTIAGHAVDVAAMLARWAERIAAHAKAERQGEGNG